MKRNCEPVPIYILDEHNEAFYFWHKARAEDRRNGPLDLFHVDAHDDMGRPGAFRKSLYPPGESSADSLEYVRDFAATELHNGNFIIPAVLAGLVQNVYFVYPKWRKFKPQRKRFNVSSVFGEGKVLKYGMKPMDNQETKLQKALPDMKSYRFSMLDIDKVPGNRTVILDIDLDYFACRDSILNQFRYKLGITAEQYRACDAFLSDKTLAFAGLQFDFSEENGNYFVQVAHKPQKDASHLPSKEEVVSEIRLLTETLRSKRIRPAVVTVARSCVSGYCPGDYVSMVEEELMRQLAPFVEGQNPDTNSRYMLRRTTKERPAGRPNEGIGKGGSRNHGGHTNGCSIQAI
jgi:hypothetical protein